MSKHLLDLWPNSLYNFTFDVPWIDPVIANAAFYGTVSSLLQKLSLFAWSYMMSPESKWGLMKDI